MMNNICVYPVTAKELVGYNMASSAYFFDFKAIPNVSWIESFEQVFDVLGFAPKRAIAHYNEKTSRGTYTRVRSRIAGFLSSFCEADSLSLELESENLYPEHGFFPCELMISLGMEPGEPARSVICLRRDHQNSLKEFYDRLAPMFYKLFGGSYSYAMEFPSIFGPVTYGACYGARPSGFKTSKHYSRYSERITCWRDAIYIGGYSVDHGYLREVYPINVLTKNQITRFQSDSSLWSVFNENGKITPTPYCSDLYYWLVADNNLEDARRIFETTNIILSAER